MTHIYILTITDMGNFGQVEHHSVWDTYDNAQVKARDVVRDLIHRDRHHGLGDTFNVDICQMDINTQEDL